LKEDTEVGSVTSGVYGIGAAMHRGETATREAKRAGTDEAEVSGESAASCDPRSQHVPAALRSLLTEHDLDMLGRKVMFYREVTDWRQDFIHRMQQPGSRLGEELTRQIMRQSHRAIEE